MCYPCSHCNKCGNYPPMGACKECRHVNAAGSLTCAGCGAALPAPPGTPAAKA